MLAREAFEAEFKSEPGPGRILVLVLVLLTRAMMPCLDCLFDSSLSVRNRVQKRSTAAPVPCTEWIYGGSEVVV